MVLFPVIASVLAACCVVAVLHDYRARPKPDKVAWGIAFGIFAVAAGVEVVASLSEWTPFLARTYYVLGATLVVGYLALGEMYLLMPRAWADRLAGLVAFLTTLAVALVIRAPVIGDVAADGWEALDRGTGLTVLTISINSVGTLILVGGLLWSVWRLRRVGGMRNRAVGCLLIALGTLAVASGGTLTRLGNHQYLYIAMTVGIALIFAGYTRARKPVTRPVEAPRSDQREPVGSSAQAGG
ncbi:MAG: hypothetical protein DCC58_16115 [Chloroflexi bacterium]|nr:MAG: hypothetical protein DCC58_16115 [Chloroflexota bacterium]